MLRGGRGLVVAHGHAQRGQRDLVVELRHRAALFGQLVAQFHGLVHVAAEQALVHRNAWRIQRGLAAQQHVEELQRRQVAPEHQQAHCRVSGVDMIRPTGPYISVQNVAATMSEMADSSGAGAIQPGLDDVVAHELEHGDEAQRPQHQAPAGVDRRRPG